MIVSETPFRISLFGGGTDFPGYFRQHGGEVLGFSIDKYCRILVRNLPPFFHYRSRIVWSKTELVNEPEQIQHPVIREALKRRPKLRRIELFHEGDLPANSGVGSSSSFCVGLLKVFDALEGVCQSPRSLALQAIQLEREDLGESGGWQDQIFAAYGGFNHIHFHQSGGFRVYPIIMPKPRMDALMERLVLVYLGKGRIASELESRKVEAMEKNTAVLKCMRDYCRAGVEILQRGSVDDLGLLLHTSWRAKRQLTHGVSTPEIDRVYDMAREAGAVGGKILGAGGGGFMLLFVGPQSKEHVLERLSDLVHVPFNLSESGSRISVYEGE